MLAVIQHHIDNPDDVPDIPNASAEYLNVRLNPSYLIATGVVDDLRKGGYSEAHILGFLDGCNAATELVDFMKDHQKQKEED